jgi:drug/metabolite transporter (DMT)-like permease
MTWLFIALAAYFLISINLTLDKVILKNSLPHPVVYCFYMGILSIFGLVFAPFGTVDFGSREIVTGLLVGAFFILPLYYMYKAVFFNEATRVGPLIGAVTPIFVWLFSFLFLGERFSWNEMLAFLLLFLGGFLISLEPSGEKRKKVVFMLKTSILAALMFGVYYVLLKYVYNKGTFVSGFVWTRLGSFLAAFIFLVSRKNRKLIFGESKILKPKTGIIIAANKTLSGVAFALLNYAIALGSVTLVNAMQGLQYVFLLIVVAFLSKQYPKILSEQIHKKALTQKIIAIFIIAAGLALTVLKS